MNIEDKLDALVFGLGVLCILVVGFACYLGIKENLLGHQRIEICQSMEKEHNKAKCLSGM